MVIRKPIVWLLLLCVALTAPSLVSATGGVGVAGGGIETPDQEFDFDAAGPAADGGGGSSSSNSGNNIGSSRTEEKEQQPRDPTAKADEAPRPLLDTAFTYAKRNPMLVVMVFVILVRLWLSSGKVVKVEGSLVREIVKNEDWNAIMTSSKEANKRVIVDFYATWCPPCRVASPRFDQMSIDYSETCPDLIFCKVDVDKHQKIAAACGVTAMPTFVLIKEALPVEGGTVKGWSETTVRQVLAQHGFRPPASGKNVGKVA